MDGSHPPTTSSRGLRLALILSLMFNLLVLGLIAGAWIRDDRDMRSHSAMDDIGFGPYLAALSGTERRDIGRALMQRAGNLRQNREAFRQDFEALIAALRREPFDIGAVSAAIDAQQARLAERLEIGKSVLYEQLTAMTPEQRRAFADGLERAMRHGPKFRTHSRHD